MIEQINKAVRFRAFYTSSKQGKAGLSVTVDVYAPDDSFVALAQPAVEVGQGIYSYTLPAGSVTQIGEYTAIFKTADLSVDLQTIPALWVVGRAGVDNLDALVSSRSTYAGTDTPGTITLLSRITGLAPLASDWTAARALKLDFLDRAVSSTATQLSVNAIPTNPLLAVNYIVPPTSAAIASAVNTSLAPSFTAVQTSITNTALGNGVTVATLLSAPTTGYPTGSAGAALDKVNLGSMPLVVPAPSPDPSTCRVYGYFETIDNQPAAGVNITITLVSPGMTASDRGIAGRTLHVKTDPSGILVGNFRPYVDLQRNDLLLPANSYYTVNCEALGIVNAQIKLTTSTLDLVAALRAAA